MNKVCFIKFKAYLVYTKEKDNDKIVLEKKGNILTGKL